jgi:hypothetical protein
VLFFHNPHYAIIAFDTDTTCTDKRHLFVYSTLAAGPHPIRTFNPWLREGISQPFKGDFPTMIPSTSSHPPSKVIPARTATGISYPSRASPSIPSSPGLQYHRQRRIGRANISSTPLSPSVTRPTIFSTGKQRSIRRSASSTSLVSLSSALRQTVPPRSPVTRRHKTKEITPSRPIPDMSVLYRQLAAALVAEIKVNFEQDGIVDLIGGANTG